jgi:16S rRNA (cytosine967-C5)-methyltransferase
MSISPARTAVFDILLQVEQEDSYASELLHSSRYAKLSPADHGLATEIVMGVLRWRSTLDSEIAHFSSQKLEKLDAEILTTLRMAVYQMAYLDRVPQRAAVNESVELVKRARKRSAVPLVNAVLRKISGHVDWAENLRRELYELESELRKGQPVTPQARVLVPAQERPGAGVLANLYSHPAWLVERWVNYYGWEAARSICRSDQTIANTALRLPAPADKADLEKAGVTLLNGELLKTAARVESGDLTHTAPYREGRIAIQDEASQLVALLVGRGTNILDCCAAPGGKTRIIADRNPEAKILAAELHPHRARLLRKLVPAKNVEVITADVLTLPVSRRFDRILADVPCSGTGTLARNPEIKWRLTLDDLADLHARQFAILQAAMQHVAPSGRLVYSTCSMESEENEQVVEKALAADPSFRVFSCRPELERLHAENELAWEDLASLTSGPYLRTIPGFHPCDGFFATILEKL